MTTPSSVSRVSPRPKGEIPEPQAQRLREAADRRDETQEAAHVAVDELRAAVVAALLAGGSIREVAETARISRSTCEAWGRADGWPSAEQQARWDAERAKHARRREIARRVEAEMAREQDESTDPKS